MTSLSVVPEAVTAASANLDDLGSALRSASVAAVDRTTAITPAAADEISAAVVTLFGSHAREFETLNARASAFHAEFVNLLNGGAAKYVSAEIGNAQQALVNAINGPAQALLGHPLIGNAAPAAATSSVSSIDTPFGPIAITQTATMPDTGNGPLSMTMSASTPIGPASLSINGQMTTSQTLGTLQLTGGSLLVPPQVRLALAAAGPIVTGGYSLFNSFNAFSSAVSSGNMLGAATVAATAPFDWVHACLFGHQAVSLPLGQLGGSAIGPSLDVRIPFGGLFASSAPMTMSLPQYSYTASGFTQTWIGSDFAFQGSQFGGLGTEVLKLVGLPL
ncbi:hypothetical protein A5634_20230 [Mycobacterium asiaticum]|uniref:PE domain-containing protein n=1 Tax=Mycobacterium asiaticum TaxID=1790 RepID=A0A1A3P7I9_MYCAS|nr:PE family protein [Mycobacterium asiaticum]OBK28552.1 hypothetical protein A5634_20230 [Mycobacterium asiaticum]